MFAHERAHQTGQAAIGQIIILRITGYINLQTYFGVYWNWTRDLKTDTMHQPASLSSYFRSCGWLPNNKDKHLQYLTTLIRRGVLDIVLWL